MENKEHYTPQEVAEFAKRFGKVLVSARVLISNETLVYKQRIAEQLVEERKQYSEMPENIRKILDPAFSNLGTICIAINSTR